MRFGIVHRVMTDTLAVLGLLSLLTSGELNRGIAAVDRGRRSRWRSRCRSAFRTSRSIASSASVAPLVLLAVQTARLLGGESLLASADRVRGRACRSSASRPGAAPRTTSRSSCSRCSHLIAGTVLGSGLAYGLCFLGFLVVTPGALVLSHLRREVEGNYRQGARDRTGLPVDVPRILRSRRVIGGSSCCSPASCRCRSSCSRRSCSCSFRASACRFSVAEPLAHRAHDRLLGAGRSRRRRQAALRSRRS